MLNLGLEITCYRNAKILNVFENNGVFLRGMESWKLRSHESHSKPLPLEFLYEEVKERNLWTTEF